MLRNYLKIVWRNLRASKLFSLLNIAGLAAGISVAMLIGLWVWDEVSFNRYFSNYEQVAKVMVNATNGTETFTGGTVSIPMGTELHHKYSADFTAISLASPEGEHIIASGEKQLAHPGIWVEKDFPAMFSIHMKSGNRNALADPSSVLLAESVAKALFQDADPLNKTIRIDNKIDLRIAGVFEDFPANTTYNSIKILMPWERFLQEADWVRNAQTQWQNHMCQLYVQLPKNASLASTSAKIKSVPTPHIQPSKEELLLHPMSNWHLYGDFVNGKEAGGRIKTVWLIGIIGIFVLLLACINFMNLSTARSEKRSREVGIRKTVGSLRGQLITQFLLESVLVAMLSLLFAFLLVDLSLPFFNQLSDKQIAMPWGNLYFWIMVLGFTVFTGLIAGSYPAFYLSGFNPVKVLKGTFKAGPGASLPRKVLVVTQFAVSVTLIIGTTIIYRQIQHAINRPVGYSRDGLLTVNMNTPDFQGHYDAIRNDLLETGAVADMAEANSAPTQVWSNNIVEWKGKDPATVVSPGTIAVTHDYGNTVGWTIKEGRDFSRNFPADTFSFILNEAAVKMTGFKNPVGQTIRWLGEEHVIVGVVKDMVMQSPYYPVRPTIFHLNPDWANLIIFRIKPTLPMREALAKIEPVFKKYNPGSPFVFRFTDEEYAKKFSDEKRIGNLAAVFATLAIFISCLGLFGLASFLAEQRTKEIGIRKVLGASVFNLWKLLSKDFVQLVLLSFAIAIPASWFFLHKWLEQFDYRTTIPWWIFPATALGVLFITLLTVAYQAISAALTNPVKSLKSE